MKVKNSVNENNLYLEMNAPSKQAHKKKGSAIPHTVNPFSLTMQSSERSVAQRSVLIQSPKFSQSRGIHSS